MQQPSFEPYAAPATDTPPGEKIRYGEAIKFAFRAEKPWMNILVSSLMAFVPIAGPMAIAGWHAEIMQRLVRRHATPIPTLEFSDFSHYLTRGVQPFVCRMIAGLPLSLIAVFGGMVAAIAGGAAARAHEPEMILVIWGIMAGFIFLMAPIMSIVYCAVFTRADLVEEVGATLKPAKLGAYMRATWATALGSFFLFGMIAFGMMLLGLVACYFGVFIASAVVQLAQLHLRWQIYERYLLRGGEPIPARTPAVLPSEQVQPQYAPQPPQYPPQYPQYPR